MESERLESKAVDTNEDSLSWQALSRGFAERLAFPSLYACTPLASYLYWTKGRMEIFGICMCKPRQIVHSGYADSHSRFVDRQGTRVSGSYILSFRGIRAGLALPCSFQKWDGGPGRRWTEIDSICDITRWPLEDEEQRHWRWQDYSIIDYPSIKSKTSRTWLWIIPAAVLLSSKFIPLHKKKSNKISTS